MPGRGGPRKPSTNLILNPFQSVKIGGRPVAPRRPRPSRPSPQVRGGNRGSQTQWRPPSGQARQVINRYERLPFPQKKVAIRSALLKPDAELSRLLLGHVGGKSEAKKLLLGDDLGSGGIQADLGRLLKVGVKSALNAKPLRVSGSAGGIPVASTGVSPRAVAVPGAVALGTAEALYRNPKVNGKSVRKRTVEDVAHLPEAIIGGVGQLAYDTAKGVAEGDYLRGPRNMGKGMAADYKERYTPLLKGDYQGFEKGIEKRGSAMPEALDLSAFAAVGGATAGRALGAAARSGAMGSRAKVFATAPRPKLRVSGGRVKEQEVSKNLFRLAGQRFEDVRRTRQNERYVRKATEKGVGAEGVFPGEGEVVPLRSPIPGLGRIINNQRRLGNKEQGRVSSEATFRMDALKDEVTGTIRRELRQGLNRSERVAVPFALQGLMPVLREGGYDIRRAVEALKMYREQILVERWEATEAEAKRIEEETGKPRRSALRLAETKVRKLREKVDSVEAIDKILEDPERYLTPNLATRAQEVMDRFENLNAGVNEGTAMRRNVRPQAEFVRMNKPTVEQVQRGLSPRQVPFERPMTMRETAETLEPREVPVEAFDEAASRKAVERRLSEADSLPVVKPGDSVGGLRVRDDVPNRPSIESSLDSSQVLDGIRQVPMRLFSTSGGHYSVEGTRRIEQLASEIADSGEITPLIVVFDADARGPYVLEGATRIEALHRLGVKSFPALVVKDTSSLSRGLNAGRTTRPETPAEMLRRAKEMRDRPTVEDVRPETPSERRARAERARERTYGSDPVDRAQQIRDEIDELRKEERSKERDEQIKALADDLMENEQDYYRQFAEDVSRQARELGLPANPVYFKHTSLARESSHVYTTGPAIRYFDDLARSNMVLFKLGLYDMSINAFERGLMATIKRATLIRAITENLETLALKVVDGKRVPNDLDLRELQHWMAAEGLSIDGYYFINPKRALGDDVLGGGDSAFFVDPTEIVQGKAMKMVEGLGPDARSMMSMHPNAAVDLKGWYAIPLQAGGKALESDAKGSGLLWRSYDRYVRGLGSAVILGTSPAWLMMQRIVDAYGLTAASRFNPLKIARTLAVYPFMWHSLTPQMREAIQATIGAGYHRRSPRIGKDGRDLAGRNPMSQWLLSTWDDITNSRAARGAAKAPGVLFMLDNWFTRHTKQMRYVSKAEEIAARQRYEALRESVGAAQASLDRVMAILRKPSAKQVEDILRDSKAFDEAADHIHRAFGDWNNLSGRERHGILRIPLFYTWLRFAGRTLFHTLPVRHPVLLAFMLELAKAHKDAMDDYYREKGALLPGEELPSFLYSRVLREGETYTDLGRISPVVALPLEMGQLALSVLTGSELGKGPRSLFTALPPTATAAIEAVLGQQLLTGAKLHIGSDPKNSEPYKVGGLPVVTKTYLNRFLQANPMYGALMLMLYGDKPISDDSLPGNAKVLQYATPQGQKGAEEKLRSKGTPKQRALQRTILPLSGLPDTTPQLLAVRRGKTGKGKGGAYDPFAAFRVGGSGGDPFKAFRGPESQDPFKDFKGAPGGGQDGVSFFPSREAPKGLVVSAGKIAYQSGVTPLKNTVIANAVKSLSASLGKTIVVSSTHRPGAITTSGNVSDHASGNAADIPARGETLTQLGRAALVALKIMPPERAKRENGGVYNGTVNGVRYQVLFNTTQGGNHYNHLHIGVAPRGGSGVKPVKAPLTKGQQTFARIVSRKTGLDRNVIAAWLLLEENQGAAKGREQEGQHNWLNIGWTDKGRLSFTYGPEWNDPKTAADATVAFLKGDRYGPSQGIKDILKTAKKSPEEQIKAISTAGWASTNYGGANPITQLYNQITGGDLPYANDATAFGGGGSYPAGSGGSGSSGYPGAFVPSSQDPLPTLLKDTSFGDSLVGSPFKSSYTKPVSITINNQTDAEFARVLERLAREFGQIRKVKT